MSATSPKRHVWTAFSVLGVAIAMVGAAYAAVPLYYAFCRATGYGGTPQRVEEAAANKGQRTLTVRFDTNVMPGLPWAFEAETPSVKLRTGETTTVFFRVMNQTGRPIGALASFNVSPDQAGSYFDKIQCFCFSETTLGPGEKADLPVVFYLDPALERDATMADVGALTLSYTLYAAKDAPKPVASAADGRKTIR